MIIRFVKIITAVALLSLVIFFTHAIMLTWAGNQLFRKDQMKPTDAIVILAGEETERVEYGVQLFKEEWAKKDRIVLAGGPLVWKHSWASLMKEHAIALGIDPKHILLEDQSRSTEEDALYTKQILKKHNIRSIILVTSPYHSRRAATIFERVMGSEIRVISAPAEKSWFSFHEWWKRRRDRAMVLNEFSKFVWLLLFGLQQHAAL